MYQGLSLRICHKELRHWKQSILCQQCRCNLPQIKDTNGPLYDVDVIRLHSSLKLRVVVNRGVPMAFGLSYYFILEK